MSKAAPHKKAEVIDLFSGQTLSDGFDRSIVRMAPEYDNLAMLYSNDANPDKLFSMKILAWGLRADGEVVGLVPWLDQMMPCPDLCDPLNGHWEGYYNVLTGDVFYEAPAHKQLELEAAWNYHDASEEPYDTDEIIQEITDSIGTHAVIADPEQNTLRLLEVFSWRLWGDGRIQGMAVDNDKVKRTPVLIGDECLYPIDEAENFRYFFQYRIANKIKEQDPEALEAIALLMDF